MSGASTLGSEIVRCPHKSLTEVILPYAIDNNARRERMIRLGQPLSQRQAPAGMPPTRLGLRSAPRGFRVIENRRNSKLHRLARIHIIAPNENATGRWGLRYVPQPPNSLRVELLVSFLVLALLGSEAGKLRILLLKLRIIRRVG